MHCRRRRSETTSSLRQQKTDIHFRMSNEISLYYLLHGKLTFHASEVSLWCASREASMNVRQPRIATEHGGRTQYRRLTPSVRHNKILKCSLSKNGVSSVLRVTIAQKLHALGPEDERKGPFEGQPSDALEGNIGQENIDSHEHKGDGSNQRSSIIRRLARAVVTFLSPAPMQAFSKFLSFRAFKLVLFLAIGLFMSYLGSRGSRSQASRYGEMDFPQ